MVFKEALNPSTTWAFLRGFQGTPASLCADLRSSQPGRRRASVNQDTGCFQCNLSSWLGSPHVCFCDVSASLLNFNLHQAHAHLSQRNPEVRTLLCEHSEQSPRADQPSCGQGSTQALAVPGTENESALSHTRLAQEPLCSPRLSRIFQGWPW